jgi:hypothetical protein
MFNLISLLRRIRKMVKGMYEDSWQVKYASTSESPFQPEERRLMDNEAIVFDVVVVYAENKAQPVVKREIIIAKSESQARLLAGKQVEQSWDTDYLTVLVIELGTITFKPKPTEVKVL